MTVPVWLRYTGLFAAAFGLFLIATLPASVLTARLLPDDSRLSLSGIDGTVWRGHVQQVMLDGRFELGRLVWRWRAGDLVAGRLGFQVTLGEGPLAATATVQFRPGFASAGTVRVGDMTLTTRIRDILPLLGNPDIDAAGRLQLVIDRARIQGRELLALQGRADWVDASVYERAGPGRRVGLGTVSIRLDAGDDGSLQGRIESGNSPLQIAGTVVWSVTDGYRLRLTLRPASPPDANTRRLLDELGPARSDGSRVLSLRGSL